MFGLHRHTSPADIVEATVAGVAHTVVDLLEAIGEVSGTALATLAVDGGLSRSDYLQQMTADLLDVPVERTSNSGDVTAMGAAWIAGIARGIWSSRDEAAAARSIEARFTPRMSRVERQDRRHVWQDAIGRSLHWRGREGA
jgi:glycerol kinase